MGERPTGSRRSWVTLLYFYVAVLTGLILIIVGAIWVLNALVDVIFFEELLTPLDEFDDYGVSLY